MKWTNPDGTPRSDRPTQNEVVINFAGTRTPQGAWQWDDVMEKWIDIMGCQPECPKCEEKFTKATSICECGSEKLGSNRHSDWCPKHG